MRTNNQVAPVPFATRMKTGLSQTTGEYVPGAQRASERRLASTSTMMTDGSVARNWNRYAQLATQTNYTAPSYYSPFTTPSSFQIPNNRKECYLWAQWWYDNEPKVAAGIDFYRDFPMSGFTLECSNSYVKDYYEKLVKKLNFAKWIPLLAHEYYLRGDVFPLASLDCQQCKGDGDWRDDNDKPCEHEGATWHALDILDPNMVDITPGFFGQDSSYFYVPTDDMKKVVQEQKPKELFECIPEAVRVACLQSKPIKLNAESIWHFKHGSSPFSPFGTSLLRRLFPTLAYKDKLRQAQWLIAERHILPIKLIKVGTNERPANDSDIQAVQDAFTNTSQDPLLTVVTHHGIEVEYVGACHSDDTEVLTLTGWKLFSQVGDSELVACYDPTTGNMQWHLPTARHEHFYDSEKYGKLINFKGQHFNSLVTPNHEMLSRKRQWNSEYNKYSHTDWAKFRADSITDHDRFLSIMSWSGSIPDTSIYQSKSTLLADVELDDFLAFAGYYLSEGTLKNSQSCIGGHCSTTVYQKLNTESCSRIQSVMKRCFGEKTKLFDASVQDWEPVRHFTIHNAELCRYMEDEFGHMSNYKKVPRWILDLPNDKLQIILDALIDGDGDVRKSGVGTKTRYSTTSKLLADAVQEIAMKLGFNPKISSMGEKSRKSHHLPIYRVYWAKKTEDRVIRSRNIERVDYNGTVYCFTVPTGVLITRRDGKIGIHGNSGKVLQLTNEYELINQDIIDGLMLNKAIINGEGPAYGAAQVGLIAMAQRLEGIRREVSYWIEERLFKPIAKWNGFTAEGKRGQEELIYPTIKWDDLQLRDDSQKLQLILQLMQAGIVSSETMIELLDLNYDQEVERLRFEQDANRVNNPALASGGGMGGGFGGPMAGGAPMPGGAGVPGGAPPSGAPVGMPMPPAMASVDDPEQAYRQAARVLHEVYGRQVQASTEAMNIRLANKRVVSEAHRGFLESEKIPSGRGRSGELPTELENIFPLEETNDVCGGLTSVPLNRAAMTEWTYYYNQPHPNISEDEIDSVVDSKVSADTLIKSLVTAANQKQNLPVPTLFTKLEQQLYNLVLGCNIPYAFYAQYSAGPTFEYQLDGAFPALKLGIEADSETFHSSPDKIAKDRRRDMELMSQGWTVLRFTDQEIERHPQEVVNVILTTLRKLAGGKSGDKGEQKL